MKVRDRIYGEINITDPLAIELIKSPIFQRLKYIYQMGVNLHAYPALNHTRYEHSIGVYYLLQKFGASREEQIAGLLHDVSHSAFSHVIDYLLNDRINNESQDKIHKTYILKSEIPGILKKHGVNVNLITDHKRWPLLDRKLPDLCADRLDYCLRDGLQAGVWKKRDIKQVLTNLRIIDSNWIFLSRKVARDYFANTLTMTNEWWAPVWGILQFEMMAQALRIALDEKIISHEDLYKTDGEVWKKLEKSKNKEIVSNLEKIKNVRNLKYRFVKDPTKTLIQGKYRAVDPLVKTDKGMERASKNAPKYLLARADKIKREVESLRYIEFIN